MGGQHGGRGTAAGMALLVFAMGIGLGFAWRQGWLPIELLPSRTGVLEDAEAVPTPNEIAPFRVIVPLADLPAETPEIVGTPGSLPTDNGPATAEIAAVGPNTSTNGVQPAGYQEAPRETAPQPAAPDVDFDATLAEADALRSAGDTLAAHKRLSKLYWSHRARRGELLQRLDELARVIFFEPQPHFVDPYVIQPGDRLESIAVEHRLSWEYLSALNRTDPRRIQAGKRLKVVRGPFAAVVELDDFALTIHLQGYFVRRYPVGIGRDGSSPIGKFPVLNKVVDPQYTDPDGRVIAGDDPANPLGERWIDLGNSYGIHGTIEPESIGSAASRGCIRLRDDDIVAVYNFLVNGSEVVIRR
jgi:hypothetical protein